MRTQFHETAASEANSGEGAAIRPEAATILADAVALYMPNDAASILRSMPTTRDSIGRHHAWVISPGPYTARAGATLNALASIGLVVRDGNRFRLSILGRMVREALDEKPIEPDLRHRPGEIVHMQAPPREPWFRRLFSRFV